MPGHHREAAGDGPRPEIDLVDLWVGPTARGPNWGDPSSGYSFARVQIVLRERLKIEAKS